MRIVYCILGTFKAGGMERALTNKANYLADLGHEITVVTTDQKARAPYFKLHHRIRCIDLEINYTDNSGRWLLQKYFSYLLKQRRHRQLLTRVLMDIRPSITISLGDFETTFLHAIRDGSRKILEVHFSRYKRLQYGRSGLWKWIDRYRSSQDLKLAKRYDKFVVLTKEDRAYWGNLHNIAVIPNANSFRPEHHATLVHKRVIAVGRLDYQKRFEDLIEAWRLVSIEAPDWRLSIFGSGPEKKKLLEQIYEAGVQHTAEICPPVGQIEKELLTSSVIAMTSRYEGLPMALLEAQACGLPMVSYACKCGPSDIIKNAINGFLVREGDILALKDKLLMLIKDESLRKKMGAEARRNSMRFNQEVVMQKWLTLFTELGGHNV